MEASTSQTAGARPADEEFVKECLEAYTSLKRGFRDLVPEDFWTHQRNVRRESLLALRSLLDGAIERLEREDVSRRREEIPVE